MNRENARVQVVITDIKWNWIIAYIRSRLKVSNKCEILATNHSLHIIVTRNALGIYTRYLMFRASSVIIGQLYHVQVNFNASHSVQSLSLYVHIQC